MNKKQIIQDKSFDIHDAIGMAGNLRFVKLSDAIEVIQSLQKEVEELNEAIAIMSGN